MKKVLSLVLVLTMVLGSFSFAFAAPASDVAGTEYEDAVSRLMALEVLTGYPDGTFKPENTINRAEFAAAIVRVLGLDASAKASAGVSVFTDVAGTNWASGYIALANKLGIVNGRGDGTFDPTAPVRYEEAVKMVMAALGYQPAAEKRGGYPIGYLSYANEEGITDGTEVMLGLPAPRGVVAILLDNALEAPMLVQKGFGDLETFEKDENQVLLKKLGLTRVNGQVENVDATYREITVGTKTYKVADSVKLEGLDKQVVTLWVKAGKVVTLTINSAVKYDFVAALTYKDNDDVNGDIIKVKLTNDGKEYRVNKDFRIVNGDLTKGNFVKVVLKSGEIVAFDEYVLRDGGLVSEVKKDTLTYVNGSRELKLRNLDDADSMLVVINGEAKTYDDIEEDMYFDYQKDGDDWVLVATDKTVAGTFDRIKTNTSNNVTEIRIAGNYKAVAAPSYVSLDEGESYSAIGAESTVEDLYKEDVFAHLNNVGKIAYLKADVEETTSTFYGFVVAVNNFGKQLRVAKDVDGKVKEVVLDTALKSTSQVKLGAVNELVADGVMNSFYKFTVNEDNTVTEIATVATVEKTASDFNSKYDYILDDANGFTYADKAVIFNIKAALDKENDADPATVPASSDIKLLKWEDIEKTSVSGTIKFERNAEKANVILFTVDSSNKLGVADLDKFVGFITGRSTIAKGEYEYIIDTATGEETYVSEDLAARFTVAIYELASKDEINVVAHAVYDNLTALTSGDFVGYGLDTVSSVSGKYITLAVNGLFKTADDVLVYEVVDAAKNKFEIADLANIRPNDKVTFLTEEGVIKVIFFQPVE